MEEIVHNDNQQTPEERVFKQQDVNDIVGKAKREAIESYKRQQAEKSQFGSAYSVSPDEIKKLAAEEIQRQREVWLQEQNEAQNKKEIERIIKTFQSKVSDGASKYEDFQEKVSDLELQYYPSVVQMLADHVDNASDVLYELANSRYKLGHLQSIHERNPKDAVYEMKKLSKSLKLKEEALNIKTPNAPLSKTKISPSSSSSQPSISELKAKYRG